MKKIPLTQGKFALVDDCDFLEISRYKWHAMKMGSTFYAGRKISAGPRKQTTVYMHHTFVFNIGGDVDHRDGNGLNNCRANLRSASRKQNAGNQKRAVNNTSGSKGVSFHSRDRIWAAQIRVDGKLIHLGNFKTRESAQHAYAIAASQYFGEFARIA